LWDCLSTDTARKKITIHKPETIIDNLGAYGESLIRLLEAAQTNEFIQVDIENETKRASS
jgi:hypothetical protein